MTMLDTETYVGIYLVWYLKGSVLSIPCEMRVLISKPVGQIIYTIIPS